MWVRQWSKRVLLEIVPILFATLPVLCIVLAGKYAEGAVRDMWLKISVLSSVTGVLGIAIYDKAIERQVTHDEASPVSHKRVER
jgi:hypothetical protein